jgi:TP901 family phage tail tape measure protein
MTVMLGSAAGKISLDAAGVREGVQAAANSLKGLKPAFENAAGSVRQAMTKLRNDLADIGAKMTLGITAPLVAIGKQALDSAMDYEAGMNMFQAVTGATADEMARAGDEAVALGADMSLPATSAADAATAMVELGKAGLSVRDSIDAARGTLQLAAAGQLEEAKAAEITANALNMFGLKGTEATRVADLLAAAANATSAEVSDMGDAVTAGGAMLAAAKVPIEDFVTALGLMANQGIKGSEAGTGIKQMFLQLQAPSKQATDLMNQYGISVYDAAGNMRPMPELIEQFSSGLGGLTQQQRDNAIAVIFGAHAGVAANLVLMGGVDAYDKMEKAVTRANAAQELAAARSKGLRGAFEGLKSQIETLWLEALVPILGIFERIVRALAELAGRLLDVNPALINAAMAFAAVLAAAGPVALALAGIITVVGALATPIGAAVLAVAGLAAAAAALATAWSQNMGGIRDKTLAAVGAIKGAFAQGGLPGVVQFIAQWAAEWWAYLQGAVPGWIGQAGQAINQWYAGWYYYIRDNVAPTVARTAQAIGQWAAEWWAYLQGAVPGWIGQAGQAINQWYAGWRDYLVANVGPVIEGAKAAIGQWAAGWLSYLQQQAPVWAAQVSEQVGKVWAAMESGQFGDVAQKITTALDPVIYKAREMADGVREAFGGTDPNNYTSRYEVFGQRVGTALRDALRTTREVMDGIREAFGGADPNNYTSKYEVFGQRVGQAFKDVEKTAREVFSGIRQLLGGTDIDNSTSRIEAAIMGLPAALQKVRDFFGPTIQRIIEAFGNLGTSLAPLGPKFEALWTAAQPALSKIAELLGYVAVVVGAVVATVAKLLGEELAAALNHAGELIGGPVDVITGLFMVIEGVVGGVVDTVKKLLAGDFVGALETARQASLKIGEGVRTALGGILEFIDGVVGYMWDALTRLINDLTGAQIPKWQQFKDAIVAIVEGIPAAIGQVASQVTESIKAWFTPDPGSLAGAVIGWFTPDPGSLVAIGMGMAGDLINAALSGIASGMAQAQMAWSNAWLAMQTAMSNVWLVIQMEVQNALDVMRGIFTAEMQIVSGDWQGAWNTISDTLTSIWNRMKETVQQMLNNIKSMLQNVKFPNPFEQLVGFINGLKAAAQSAIEKIKELLGLNGARGGGGGGDDGGGGNARGTNFYPGGIGLVGERGPELVRLPRGSQIIPNSETMRLLAASMGMAPKVAMTPATAGGAAGYGDYRQQAAGPVSLSIHIDRVGDDIDVEQMAYKVLDVLKWRTPR